MRREVGWGGRRGERLACFKTWSPSFVAPARAFRRRRCPLLPRPLQPPPVLQTFPVASPFSPPSNICLHSRRHTASLQIAATAAIVFVCECVCVCCVSIGACARPRHACCEIVRREIVPRKGPLHVRHPGAAHTTRPGEKQRSDSVGRGGCLEGFY